MLLVLVMICVSGLCSVWLRLEVKFVDSVLFLSLGVVMLVMIICVLLMKLVNVLLVL